MIYDFPKFLKENMNERLEILKKGESTDFRWYSHLYFYFYFDKEVIAQTNLVLLHEKLNSRFFSFHEVCNILYLAIRNMEVDRKLVKPTYHKCVDRIEKKTKNRIVCETRP